MRNSSHLLLTGCNLSEALSCSYNIRLALAHANAILCSYIAISILVICRMYVTQFMQSCSLGFILNLTYDYSNCIYVYAAMTNFYLAKYTMTNFYLDKFFKQTPFFWVIFQILE